MPKISVTARTGAAEETAADTRVVGLFEGESPPAGAVAELVESGEAKPGLRKLAVTHEDGPGGGRRRVIAVGLGKRDELDAEKARVAAGVAAQRARELGARSLSWAAPSGEGAAGALVEGTLLALYRFDAFKSKRDEDDGGAEVESLEIASEVDSSTAVEQARVRAEATNAARDLQNTPSNVATPEFLAERAREIVGAHDSLSLELLDRGEIESRGMGAFAAVAQGSDREPRLIVIRYEGAESPHLGFVGKAVTFDTGGISIKPAAKMQEMKFDMSGGAAVIEAMGALAELAVPVRVTAVVPSTENMPSGHSMKPGDIVTAMNGKTIEINNTDAEGRLILADALAYVVEQGAERIVDLATLTGAIVVALGSTYAGLFSNDDDWYEDVEQAGRAVGELGWRMPLHPDFLELTKGQYADLSNAADVRKASSSYAAEFLRQFVDDRPWVHVDIAGTAWNGTRPYVGASANGFGTRMLIELAQRAADKAARS
jgi:leucyl aminopeptidase